MKGGRYRPAYVHALKAGLDAEGQHRRLGAPHRRPVDHRGRAVRGVLVQNGIDATSVEGAQHLPYAIPNRTRRPDHHRRRRAGALVALGRLDPQRLRRRGLPRRAGRGGGRGSAGLPAGAARGRAAPRRRCCGSRPRRPAGARRRPRAARAASRWPRASTPSWRRSRRSASATAGSGCTRLSARSTAACAINPDNIRAQMEGGIGFGLGAILAEELTLTGGEVDQANYDSYTPLRIDAMPEVEVHIVPSTERPDRRRRAGRAADRAGGRQRHPCRHGQADPRAADRQGHVRVGARSTESAKARMGQASYRNAGYDNIAVCRSPAVRDLLPARSFQTNNSQNSLACRLQERRQCFAPIQLPSSLNAAFCTLIPGPGDHFDFVRMPANTGIVANDR